MSGPTTRIRLGQTEILRLPRSVRREALRRAADDWDFVRKEQAKMRKRIAELWVVEAERRNET